MHLIFLSFLLFATQALADGRICYFSLNNPKEYTETKAFLDKLNAEETAYQIEVEEFLESGSNPEDAFKKMIESGVQCDGLVISGHHYGGYSGKRADGSLSLKFLEDLSCDPKYQGWFEKIKATWLQGCRTLGVHKIEGNADDHSIRINGEREADSIETSVMQMNTSLASVLDFDNPLSTRYMRIFPQSTIFGWTKTAPGTKARSERSFLFHMANMTKRLNDRSQYFDDPFGKVSLESAVAYSNALKGILSLSLEVRSQCGLIEASTEGWIDQGNPSRGGKYAFNVPELDAQIPLYLSANEKLKTAKRLDCLLKHSTNKKDIVSTVDLILGDEQRIGYSFNQLWELLYRLRQEGSFDLLDTIKNRYRSSPLLGQFLMKKGGDPNIGLLSKINYYGFERFLFETRNPEREAGLKKIAMEHLVKKSFGTSNRALGLRDFQQSIWEIMANHELVDREFIDEVIKRAPANKWADTMIPSVIGTSPVAIEGEKDLILKSYRDNPNSNSVSELLFAVRNATRKIDGDEEIINTVIDSPHTSSWILFQTTVAIEKQQIERPFEKYLKILNKKSLSKKNLRELKMNLQGSHQLSSVHIETLTHAIDDLITSF